MAYYSYKAVMQRDDFLAAIKPCLESLGSIEEDYDGSAGYDGDGWRVAAYLLDQKDKEIEQLKTEIERLVIELNEFKDQVSD